MKDGPPLKMPGWRPWADKCGVKTSSLSSSSGPGDTVNGAQARCLGAPGRHAAQWQPFLLPVPSALGRREKTVACPLSSLSQKHLTTKQFRLIKGKDKRQAESKTSVCLLVCYKAKQLLSNDRAY